MTDSQKSQRRIRIGNALIRFGGVVLLFSSLVKFAHLAKPVAYMSFLGYQDGKMFLIAAIEMVIGVLFLLRATRAPGLLLVSSYFGGAIAAHLASSPLPRRSAGYGGAGKRVDRRVFSPPAGELECE